MICEGVIMARLLIVAGLAAALSGCSVPEHVAEMMAGESKEFEIGAMTPTSQLVELATDANAKLQPPPM